MNSDSFSDGIEFPNQKYYDEYNYRFTVEGQYRRILGDATGEMGPFTSNKYGTQTRQVGSWYADEEFFVYSSSPWFDRGGAYNYGTGSGIFNFYNLYGLAWKHVTYRVVLTM